MGVLPAAGASPQRPQPRKSPQIESWHAHNSLHCGEGSSPKRQLSGIVIHSLLPWTPVSGSEPGTCAVRWGSCLLWGGKWKGNSLPQNHLGNPPPKFLT